MANPVRNPYFAAPGTNPGQAEHWNETYPGYTGSYPEATEVICCFTLSTDQDTPWESFEGLWDNNQLAQSAFGMTDLVSAKFEYGAYQYDSFEKSWVMPASQDMAAPRWVHQSITEFGAANISAASFDSTVPEDTEDFEEEWDNVEDAVADLSAAATSAASFDSGTPEDMEDFEEEWQDVENAVADLSAGSTTAAMFDGGANAYESFEGSWTMTL